MPSSVKLGLNLILVLQACKLELQLALLIVHSDWVVVRKGAMKRKLDMIISVK